MNPPAEKIRPGRTEWNEFLATHWQSLILSGNGRFLRKMEKAFLTLLSLFYRVGVRIRNEAFDRNIFTVRKCSLPVISIGNLSVGGTGKTPVVMWCIERLLSKKISPAVLSRGYGKENGSGSPRVVPHDVQKLEDSSLFGDEPTMIARRFAGVPVISGASRIQAARLAAEQFASDCILLDDGFQHRALHRDLDIVCLDDRMLKAPAIFPRGLLREDVQSLKRAGFAVLKTDQSEEDFLSSFQRSFSLSLDCPTAVFSYAAGGFREHSTGRTRPPDWISGRKTVAFSGIADPDGFEDILRRSGAGIISHHRFADHHRYDPQDLGRILSESRSSGSVIVTTEKDLVKVPGDFPAWALIIRPEWRKGERDLEESVLRALARR